MFPIADTVAVSTTEAPVPAVRLDEVRTVVEVTGASKMSRVASVVAVAGIASESVRMYSNS